MSKAVGNEVSNEKPLVTFALIAYNQEKFIQQAVESAFSQTYSPLEIILSDDCSTDGTYEILQEIVKNYNGNHKVILRQTPRNLGVLSHVLNAAYEANGKFIILAAGDDISKPERTQKLTDTWKTTNAWGIHSRFDRIDENGILFGISERSDYLLKPDYRLRQYFYHQDGDVDIVHGVTSAYDKRLFDFLKNQKTDHILSEDGVFSLLLNLINEKIAFVDDSLVCYRTHQGSITNSSEINKTFTLQQIKDDIKKNASYSLSIKCRAQLILDVSNSIQERKLRRLNKEEICIDIEFYEMAYSWINSKPLDRFFYVLKCRRKDHLLWMLQRLPGYNLFSIIKFTIRYAQNLIQIKRNEDK